MTYQRAATREIERCGGFVAKYMGDGIVAYFGYPAADEDDAERAVRCALGLVRIVGGLASSAGPLSARVGVATGSVIVGDLIGEGSARGTGDHWSDAATYQRPGFRPSRVAVKW